MKIKIVGAGPAGLYFAALMKRDEPSHDITVFDRGARHATWGFGVVFSEQALEFLAMHQVAVRERYRQDAAGDWVHVGAPDAPRFSIDSVVQRYLG